MSGLATVCWTVFRGLALVSDEPHPTAQCGMRDTSVPLDLTGRRACLMQLHDLAFGHFLVMTRCFGSAATGLQSNRPVPHETVRNIAAHPAVWLDGSCAMLPKPGEWLREYLQENVCGLFRKHLTNCVCAGIIPHVSFGFCIGGLECQI